MVISKQKGTYSEYTCKISFGQLEAIYDALAADHSGPVKDEMYKALEYYFAQLPLPGEDGDKKKEEEKAAEEETKDAELTGAEREGEMPPPEIGSVEELDKVAPAPPGEEVA